MTVLFQQHKSAKSDYGVPEIFMNSYSIRYCKLLMIPIKSAMYKNTCARILRNTAPLTFR